MATVSLRALTAKTLFLLSLATAKRIGELQNLSLSVMSCASDIVVSYLPRFLAKTETLQNPLPRSFPVKSLADFAGNLEDRKLCPVRALKCYLARTKDLPGRSQHLFCSVSNPSRALSKNGISFFLREVITNAGAVRGDGATPPRAHSIRAVATSKAFARNVAVNKILTAATWRMNSVFSTLWAMLCHWVP